MRWPTRDGLEYPNYRPWFAWHPVSVEGVTVWWEWIERSFVYAAGQRAPIYRMPCDSDAPVPQEGRPASNLQGSDRMKTDPVHAAAAALIRRSKDADAIATVGYRYAIEPFLNDLEAALPPKPISSRKLIALLDDQRIAAAVNEKGGGRFS